MKRFDATDSPQSPLATGRALPNIAAGEAEHEFACGQVFGGQRSWYVEQFPAAPEILFLAAVGKKPVVADAASAGRQDVQQEAP